MKRIVFTVSNDLNYDQRMEKICTSLCRDGYDILLIGRTKKSSQPLKHRPYRQKRLRLAFEKGKLFYVWLNFALFWHLLLTRADILCAIDLDTILPCMLAGKLRRKKVAYDAHEYFTEVPEVIRRPIIKSIWKSIERLAVPKMDLCYTVSESLAELYRREYGVNFSVIRNLPRHLEGSAVSEDTKPYILYQGALNEGRGLEELIEAMRVLPLDLLIAGEGDLSEELREKCRLLDLDGKVFFKGWVEPENLKILTQQAYIGYNLLANKGMSYFYSLSNKFFDYIQAGVPSLSPNFPEYIRLNNKYNISILTNLSTENIVSCVRNLLNRPDLYQLLRKNCLKTATELTWEKEEQKLLNLYDGI